MEKQTIISKGKYTHRQPEQLIFLKQYMYIRSETGEKRLLLRFVNERNEPCSVFSFLLTQLDAKGAVIREDRFESNRSRAAGKSFAFEQTIAVEERCTDFRLRILHATFGDYTYRVEEAGVLVTYEKANQLSREISSAKEGETRSVRSTAKKRRWLFVGVALAVMLILFTAAAFLLYNFITDRAAFSLSGVEYEFVTAADGSNAVEITGYSGFTGAMLLPNEIEGYPVLGIRERAFAGNSRVRRVRVEGLNISQSAFQDCAALTEVELVNAVSIENNAFYNCDKLSSVTITGAEHIGTRAFGDCDRLAAMSISHEDDNKMLILGEYAFADCQNLAEVTISQWIVYPAVQDVFSGNTAMRKLHLRNFAYTFSDTAQSAQSDKLMSLFATNGSVSMNRLTEVSIDYIDTIPAGFCRGFQALKTLSIGKSEIKHISDFAFQDCSELTTISLPVAVTSVGEKAFYYTALTAFDGSALTSIGDSAFEGCAALADVGITAEQELTSIGKSAFAGCKALKSIVIPKSVTVLNEGTFRDCTALETVTMPTDSSVDAIPASCFAQCTALRLISLPKSVKRIETSAFAGCISLLRVDSEGGIASYGDRAFSNCSSLTAWPMTSALTSIGEFAFSATAATVIVVPDSVQTVGFGAFEKCEKLSELTLPFLGNTAAGEAGQHLSFVFGASLANQTGVVPAALSTVTLRGNYSKLPDYAFYGCEGLSSVNFSQPILSIGRYAFQGCKKLTAYDLSGITDIGEGAFSASGLQSVTLPDSMVSVPSNAFEHCEALTSVTLPQNVMTIGTASFAKCTALEQIALPTSLQKLSRSSFEGCTKLAAITLPESLVAIEESVFANCAALEQIVLPASIRILPQSAFAGCVKLARVTLPDVLTVIENAAFADCTALTDIALPTSLVSLGDEAFARSGLTSITVVPYVNSIGSGAFAGCAALTDMTIPFVGGSVYSNQYLGYLFGTANLALPKALKRVTVAGTIGYTVPEGAFAECRTLKEVVLGEGVVGIAANSFTNCSKLCFLSLPKSLKTISNSFQTCYRLYEVENLSGIDLTWHSSNVLKYALEIRTASGDQAPRVTQGEFTFAYYGDQWCLVDYDDSLTSHKLPSKITYGGEEHTWMIPNYFFYLDQKLQSITVSSAVRSIGSYAFHSTQLQTLDLSAATALQTIGDRAFSNTQLRALDLSAATSLQTIGDSVFSNCHYMQTMVMPAQLETINRGAFESCSQLSVVKLPDALREIGNNAFVGCTNLYDVYYTGNALSLALGSRENGSVMRYAVALHRDMNEGLSAVTTLQNGTITLRYWNNVGLITQYSGDATVLELANLQSGITDLRIAESVFAYRQNLQKVVLGAEVTSVQRNAFYNCSKLCEVIIHSQNLTTVEEGTFADCYALRSVVLPDSVISIGQGAFQNCYFLETVTMPSKLETIGSCAFQNCRKLLSITIPVGVTAIGSQAFWGCNQLFEVYDLSTALTLTVGSPEHGSVAENAKYVHYTSTAQGLAREERDGFLFVKADNAWYLYSYHGTGASSPLSIPAIGANVTVLYGALRDLAVSSVVLPKNIKYIEDDAFYNMSQLNTVYYEGDEDDWGKVQGVNQLAACTVYYYDECVHEAGRWTYANGAVTTAKCALTWKVTTPPTCEAAGVKTGTCACGCGYFEEEPVEQLVHLYEDGFCKYCREEEPKLETPEQEENNENPVT